MLQSNWKLTLDPTSAPFVLLNHGEMLAEEIRFPMVMGLEVVNIPGSGTPFLRQTGNVLVTMEYERFIVPTNPAQQADMYARRDVLNSLIGFSALSKKPMKLEIYGLSSSYWTFANAAVTYLEPSRLVHSGKPRLSQRIRVTATGLTRTDV